MASGLRMGYLGLHTRLGKPDVRCHRAHKPKAAKVGRTPGESEAQEYRGLEPRAVLAKLGGEGH